MPSFNAEDFARRLHAELASAGFESKLLAELSGLPESDAEQVLLVARARFIRDPDTHLTIRVRVEMTDGSVSTITPQRDGAGFIDSAEIAQVLE